MVTALRSGPRPRTARSAFALVALDGRPRYALQGLGGVAVGQLADAVRVHHALHAVGAALLTQGLVQAVGLAVHGDAFAGLGGFLSPA